MLKAIISAGNLKDSTEAISTIVDETRLSIKEDGISLKAVDPSNVALVSLRLSKEGFESFEGSEGVIGVDIVKLEDILGMVDRNDEVKLEVNEGGEKLTISVRGLTYTLSLLDPSSMKKEPTTSLGDLPATVAMEGSEFRRAIRAAEKISDHVALGVKEGYFFVEAKGEADKMQLRLSEGELMELSGGDTMSWFSLSYLSDMSKPIGKSKEVALGLGKDYPVRIAFSLGNAEIEYLLAPRIESEF